MANNPQKFAAEFAKMLRVAGDKAGLVVKKSALQVLSSIEIKSPVGDPDSWASPAPPGYTGGQFRANWNLSIESMDTSTTEDKDPSGEAAKKRAQGRIESYKLGDRIFITNSLPYAYRLEYEGWSKIQAPQGMVRITALEFEKYVSEQAAKIR